MSKSWRTRYEALTAFVDDQPLVEIGESVVSIDEAVRNEFYKKFNDVRVAFLAQDFSEWLDKAHLLSSRYIKIEDDLGRLLNLEAVMMPVALKRFLSDPLKQAVRDLFDPLFELLQEKIEPEVFEERATQSVRESFRDFYQRGFIKWFVLHLVKEMGPEKIFEVPMPKPTSKQLIKHRDDVLQNVPFPCETELLRFEVDRSDILLAPDFIINSKKLGKFVAFRTELGKALWRASYFSARREWFDISSLIEKYGFTELKPDLLLYFGDHLEDLSLIADCEKLCRPDAALFFMDPLDFEESREAQKMESIRLAHDILKPFRGTYVFSQHHLPENLEKGLDENIHTMHFGFNKMNLDALMTLIQPKLSD